MSATISLDIGSVYPSPTAREVRHPHVGDDGPRRAHRTSHGTHRVPDVAVDVELGYPGKSQFEPIGKMVADALARVPGNREARRRLAIAKRNLRNSRYYDCHQRSQQCRRYWCTSTDG